MKPLLLVPLLFFLLMGCERPKGFTLKKITSHHTADPKWGVEQDLEKETLATYLQGPYTYLGSGNHTYAFESPDKKTVIKFFKQKHMRTSDFFISSKTKKRREKERDDSFSSYKIAYEKLKEETGLLYLHLNKTSHLDTTLTLIDQEGKSLAVSLDDMEFYLQKKGVLALEYLEGLFQEKAYDKAILAVRSLLHLIATRNQKGLYDKDLQFFKNFAFVDGEPIEIDIGEFRNDVPIAPTYQELEAVSAELKQFIDKNAHEFSPIAHFVIDKDIESYR